MCWMAHRAFTVASKVAMSETGKEGEDLRRVKLLHGIWLIEEN